MNQQQRKEVADRSWTHDWPTDNQEIERAELAVRGAFRVGRAADPQPEDPLYAKEEDAIERAQAMANAYGFHTPIAVWDGEDRPLHLYILGEQFRRV